MCWKYVCLQVMKCMALHNINGFHLRYDIWYDLFQTCYYIDKMLSSKYMRFKMLQMDEKRKRKKTHK